MSENGLDLPAPINQCFLFLYQNRYIVVLWHTLSWEKVVNHHEVYRYINEQDDLVDV